MSDYTLGDVTAILSNIFQSLSDFNPFSGAKSRYIGSAIFTLFSNTLNIFCTFEYFSLFSFPRLLQNVSTEKQLCFSKIFARRSVSRSSKRYITENYILQKIIYYRKIIYITENYILQKNYIYYRKLYITEKLYIL